MAKPRADSLAHSPHFPTQVLIESCLHRPGRSIAYLPGDQPCQPGPGHRVTAGRDRCDAPGAKQISSTKKRAAQQQAGPNSRIVRRDVARLARALYDSQITGQPLSNCHGTVESAVTPTP